VLFRYLKPLFCRLPQRQRQEEPIIITTATELEELHSIESKERARTKSRQQENSESEEKMFLGLTISK
jgi:hypothetical protein